jgi:hypothetical protein
LRENSADQATRKKEFLHFAPPSTSAFVYATVRVFSIIPPKLVLKKYFPIAIFALKNAYDAAAKAPGFAHRNWFRDKDTLTAIRYEIDKLWPMFKAESSKYSF